jgi:hypothetical protein
MLRLGYNILSDSTALKSQWLHGQLEVAMVGDPGAMDVSITRRTILVGAALFTFVGPGMPVSAANVSLAEMLPNTYISDELAKLGAVIWRDQVLPCRYSSARSVSTELIARITVQQDLDIQHRIDALIQKDFREGRMVPVRGWYLAETEALIALAVFQYSSRS